MLSDPVVTATCDICGYQTTIRITKPYEIVRYNVEACLTYELTELGWKCIHKDSEHWEDVCFACVKKAGY